MKKRPQFEKKVYVDCVSVSPNQISFYSRPIDGFHYSHNRGHNPFIYGENKTDGEVSKRAAKKIQSCLEWLIFMSKPKNVTDHLTGKKFTFKINFITLTLSATQIHSDQVIKDVCLNNFLVVARKNGLRNYVWRAEAQPSSGNIHFHITTDKYIHYDTIRRWWNQSQALLGYIDAFQFKHKHRNPNSTDVHSVKHVKKLAGYLSKYLCKNRSFAAIGELRKIKGEVIEIVYGTDKYRKEKANEKKGVVIGHMLSGLIRPINGRLWGASTSLSRLRNLKFTSETEEIKTFFDFCQEQEFHNFQSQWSNNFYGDIAKSSEVWFPDLYKRLTVNCNMC